MEDIIIPLLEDEIFSCTSSLLINNNNVMTHSNVGLAILDGTFFDVVYTTESGSVVASCKKCLPNIIHIKGKTNCSSNFKNHLKRKHGQETIQEYETYIKNKKSRNSNASSSLAPRQKSQPYSQDEFDRDVVKYFAHSMISLKSIEDMYFKEILDRLNTSANKFRVMSRRTLGRKITEFYNEERTMIKQEMDEVKYICTTVDIWSGRKRSFLGVTAHWMDSSSLQRVSRALACRRFKGTHSYDKVYELLLEIYAIFGLHTANVVACITDNGSNFVKAFENFGVECINITNTIDSNLNSCNESEHDTTDSDVSTSTNVISPVECLETCLPVHLRCASHTISLCATDANRLLEMQESALKRMHEQVINKCNSLWKSANRPKTAEILNRELGHTLSRPVETRWNSLYDALKKILTIQDKSLPLHRALNLRNPLVEVDFTYVKEYIKCTKPIADALDILQGENATYYGIFLPTIISLQRKLRKLCTPGIFEYCQPLAEVYLASVQRRFSDFLSIYGCEAEKAALAAISHPKYKKIKWMSLVGQQQYEKIKKLLINEISLTLPTQAPIERAAVRSREEEFFDTDSDSETQYSLYDPQSKAELLVSFFMADENVDLKMLDSHPEIRNVFLQYNTPLPSSAPVERLFSFATMLNTPKSNRLSDEMFEKRVVLKANLNYLKADTEK